ncbi:MAG: sulfatase, partial [Acidobacteria bacterium]|nr:sulfatase [Acidobacteriota bacterium]
MNNRISRRSLLAAAAAGAARPAQRPTNILLVTADDLGPLLSCYGEKLIRTPNLDRLASSGVRFQVAYVTQASCSPSRSSIFTGLYPHSTGQYGLTGAGFALHPHLHTATIPAVLKKAGYRTGIIGKLHVDPESTFPFDVNQKTFPTRRVREVASAAAAFLNQPARDPFFLMVNYSDPHAFRRENDRTAWYFPPQVEGLPEKPIQPGAATLFPWQQIDTPEQRERTANYYNAILRLDAGMGMLLEELEKAGRANDTLVIFCGDHGPPFARGKTTVYEHGLRVPFVVRWPGVSKPMVSSAMLSTVDIAPTIFDAAGVQSPVRMHGRSLRPVVGSARAPWREYLAGEFH